MAIYFHIPSLGAFVLRQDQISQNQHGWTVDVMPSFPRDIIKGISECNIFRNLSTVMQWIIHFLTDKIFTLVKNMIFLSIIERW